MSSNNDNDSSPHQELLTSLAKTNTTITSSLHRSIRHHVNNKEYNARTDGLDFLQSKNGIMISYLIDLTMLLKLRLNQQNQQQNGDDDEEKSMQQQQQEECINRLLEMKAALEKMRPLEKRMRYQIDKLLALSTLGAGMFAAVGREEEEIEKANEEEKMENDDQEGNDDDDQDEKALSFKPDLQGMMRMFEEDDDEVGLLLLLLLLFHTMSMRFYFLHILIFQCPIFTNLQFKFCNK